MPYQHVKRLTLQEVEALPAVLTTREACGVLGLQMNSLQRLTRQGRIPASKVGARLMFSKATICALAGLDSEEVR